MGDGGWRRIDAAAARHILTRVGLSALGTALHGRCLKRSGERSGAAGASRPHTKGRRFIGAALFLYESDLSRWRQRGQKPLAAPRYSIAVTLRRIRI